MAWRASPESTAICESAECSGGGRAPPVGTSYPPGAPPLSLLHARCRARGTIYRRALPAAGVNTVRASQLRLQFPQMRCGDSASSAS